MFVEFCGMLEEHASINNAKYQKIIIPEEKIISITTVYFDKEQLSNWKDMIEQESERIQEYSKHLPIIIEYLSYKDASEDTDAGHILEKKSLFVKYEEQHDQIKKIDSLNFVARIDKNCDSDKIFLGVTEFKRVYIPSEIIEKVIIDCSSFDKKATIDIHRPKDFRRSVTLGPVPRKF